MLPARSLLSLAQGVEFVEELQDECGRGGTGFKVAADAVGAANACQLVAIVGGLLRVAADVDDVRFDDAGKPVIVAVAGADDFAVAQLDVVFVVHGSASCAVVCRQLLPGGAVGVAVRLRQVDVDGEVQVARFFGGDAFAFEAQVLPAFAVRGDGDVQFARRGHDFQTAAERRRPRHDADVLVHVFAVFDVVRRVFVEADFQVEVAVFTAVKSRQALTAQADLLAFDNAFGDFDVQGFAGVGHFALRGEGRHIEAEAALAALVGGGDVDGEFGMLVFALDWPAGALGTSAVRVAEGGEDVVEAEITAAEGLAVAEAAVVEVVFAVAARLTRVEAAKACVACLSGKGVGECSVVGGAFFRVFQGVVGLVDFAGFFVGIRVFADVGVVLPHQAVIRLFDVGSAGVLGNAEDVVVGFGHRGGLVWGVGLF